jgi:cytochrome c5
MRLAVLIVLLAACTNTKLAEPTGATCADAATNPLTWESFGQQFMATYCTQCHSATLTHAQRNGAPLFHDYDTLRDTMKIPDHIDEQAGAGPNATNTRMPPSRCPTTPGGALDRDCPQPSDEDRAKLAEWLACEIIREQP